MYAARVTTGASAPAGRPGRRSAGAAALLVVLLATTSAGLRIQLGLSDPGLDAKRPERVLKSDPALLIYVTEGILRAGGRPPADFRADPRIEHPETTDIPATLTVGQEFLTAWAYAATGRPAPLHVFALWLWGAVAGLTVVGIYGATRELTGTGGTGEGVGAAGPALLAAALWVAAPASYRTAGVVLIREDLSLPLFALHGWLVLRAARVGTRGAFALAAAPLLAALATWHAMGFFVAVEAAVALAWGLRTGRSPLRGPVAWVLPALVAAGSLAVPVLRAKGFLLSLPALLTAGLVAQAALDGRSRAARTAGALAAVGALALLARALAAEGVVADYSHVFELFVAKVSSLGVRPTEAPGTLGFGARLLWQGPFETGSIRELLGGATVPVVLLPVAALLAAPAALRGRGDGRAAALVAFAATAALLAWLVRRNLAVAAPALAVAAGWVASRAGAGPGALRPWLAGLALAQLVAAAGILPHRQLVWYFPLHQDELAAALHFIEAEVPEGAAVAADFVNGAAVLAGTGHPIVLQPKYETLRSRQRVERFLTTLYRGSLADLRALLHEWRSPYLLVDRQTLWQMRWMAGLPEGLSEPVPGTAAAALLSTDAERLARVPGFALRYRSALPGDMMRVFEVR